MVLEYKPLGQMDLVCLNKTWRPAPSGWFRNTLIIHDDDDDSKARMARMIKA
jgi:hypothetical protein